jgi:PAS domain S-box-containing protein
MPFGDSLTRIHPDDRQRMKNALEKAISGKTVYDEECRIFLPNGEMRWLKDRGQVVVDQKGEPSYIIGAATDITDQKKREEALAISEQRFRGMFDNTSVGIAIVNLNGAFLKVNPYFSELFGFIEEELLKMDVLAITHPDFIDSSISRIQQMMLGKDTNFTDEKKYVRKDGQIFWGQVSVSLVKDLAGNPKHFVSIISNIHEKKLAEEALKMQARVLESMDEGVSVSDEKGFILYTNSAEDAIFGYEPGELVGKHVTIQNAYTPEENQRIVASVLEELKINGYWNGEWHNRRKDGTHFYTYSHITSLDLGERRVLVCVQRDITEEKRYKEALQRSAEELEKRVLERTRELKEANEQLERSNAELEQFAYVTSHDLQEPLRKIKTFASRIEDELAGNGTSTVQSHLSKVITSAERMSVLIKDLLNYSRLTKVERAAEDVNLNEMVHDVLSDLEVLVSQKSATIYTEALPVIKGIRLQLNQLFFNLIGNSLKFSKPGVPPLIQITAKLLSSAEAYAEGLRPVSFYQITFQDNGIGFHPKYSDQIFEIFQRLHAREAYAGTGIGLALSKKVVENHHGVIKADSLEGQGARFVVYLPADA